MCLVSCAFLTVCLSACLCCLCAYAQVCSWYDGPTLFETLDTVEVQQR